MSWTYQAREIDNHAAGVLIDERFRTLSPVRELPHLAWFCVYCRHAPGDGFWHPDETASLDSIEQDLMHLCGQFGRGWAVYVMRIDTRGIREYYFYCGEAATLDLALPSLRKAFPTYRIEFEETTDAAWSRYKTFLPDSSPRDADVHSV